MAKKPAKTKKTIEVMTVPMPKAKASSEANSQIGALNSLVASEGWAIIVKILNENIVYLEKAILDKIDPATKEGLTDEEVEKLRDKRNLNIELRETPQKYSRVLVETGEVPENFDPYWTVEDIRKMESSLKT